MLNTQPHRRVDWQPPDSIWVNPLHRARLAAVTQISSSHPAPEPDRELLPDLRATDFDLELIESRTLDGNIQELIYRPTLHV